MLRGGLTWKLHSVDCNSGGEESQGEKLRGAQDEARKVRAASESNCDIGAELCMASLARFWQEHSPNYDCPV